MPSSSINKLKTCFFLLSFFLWPDISPSPANVKFSGFLACFCLFDFASLDFTYNAVKVKVNFLVTRIHRMMISSICSIVPYL